MIDLEPLVAVMRALRDPQTGCPWDKEQSFATIVPYTIEEAYEVADAIAADDMAGLAEELGDLLLQVVYHTQIAHELGAFSIEDVIAGITAKMIRRHPHVFGETAIEDAAAQTRAWEIMKAAEKPRAGALDGVARALPAAMRAQKLQARASRVGFDWDDADGPRDKILEELEEVRCASDAKERVDEIGDLLFAVINLARHLDVDAEEALRAANDKFERRFRTMEAIAGSSFTAMTMDEKEILWQRAKSGA